MAINFNNALGIHEQALTLRSQRAEVLANNLANADTPNFKARDMDFRTALAQATGGQDRSAVDMAVTRSGHLHGLAGSGVDASLLYRTPTQPSIDGNTVEVNVEQAEFAKNAVDFQAGFRFLNGKFKSLTSAIKGE